MAFQTFQEATLCGTRLSSSEVARFTTQPELFFEDLEPMGQFHTQEFNQINSYNTGTYQEWNSPAHSWLSLEPASWNPLPTGRVFPDNYLFGAAELDGSSMTNFCVCDTSPRYFDTYKDVATNASRPRQLKAKACHQQPRLDPYTHKIETAAASTSQKLECFPLAWRRARRSHDWPKNILISTRAITATQGHGIVYSLVSFQSSNVRESLLALCSALQMQPQTVVSWTWSHPRKCLAGLVDSTFLDFVPHLQDFCITIQRRSDAHAFDVCMEI